jgi:hypothetical protein
LRSWLTDSSANGLRLQPVFPELLELCDTDLAVTVPPDPEPVITTVLPGSKSETLPLCVTWTVVEGVVLTFTTPPLDVVT